MIELTRFETARPLLTPLLHYRPVAAVLAGDAPGRIFVDDAAAPQTAVCQANQRIYLAGRAGSAAQTAVHQLFQTTILPEAQAGGLEAYVLHTTASWQEAAAVALPFAPPLARTRRLYRLDARGGDWSVTAPEGLRLRPVDAALLADNSITNLDFVTGEMVSERPSVADFLARSSGVCLQHENEIIGWCMSEYNSGARCEIGIAVAEGWRRRGLATLLARALIGAVAAQGVYDIGWLCWADNEPSVKTAETLGFTLVDERDNFLGFVHEWLHFAVHGNWSMENGRYAAAADFYERALTVKDDAPPWLLWNAACAAVRAGQPEQAAEHLHAAIDAGFSDGDRLATSPHLAALRETAVWPAILARLPAAPHVEIWDDGHPRWGDLLAVIDGAGQKPWAADWRDWYLSDHMLVALLGDDIAGFLRLVRQPIGPDTGCEPMVFNGEPLVEAKVMVFAVAEAYRRRGVGWALQEAAIREARRLGCYQMRSYSSGDKPANHHLKLRLGFAVQPRVRDDDNRGAYFIMPLATAAAGEQS